MIPSLQRRMLPRNRCFSMVIGSEHQEKQPPEEQEDTKTHGQKNPQPWKQLLETPARASWRVTDPHPPEALADAMEHVLIDGGRTPKQLLRAHQQVLEVQSQLAEYRERERRRLVNSSSSSRRSSSSSSSHYKKNKENESVHPVYYGVNESLANIQYRLFPNYAITKRVLEEVSSLVPSLKPKRILDFGMGSGSASIAALEVYHQEIEWIHGIEPSVSMRDYSQTILEQYTRHITTEGITSTNGIGTSPRITYGTTLSMSSSSSEADATSGAFDLALCVYTGTEFPDIMSTLAGAAMLFQKLQPGGILVVIEPGTPDGFNTIRSIRNMLLDCCPPRSPTTSEEEEDDDEEEEDMPWEEECHIIAPCTHNGSCPMVRHQQNFSPQKGKLAHDLPQVLSPQDSDEIGDDDEDDFDDDDDDDIMDLSDLDLSDMDWEDEEEFLQILSAAQEQHEHGKKQQRSMKETNAFDTSFCSFVQTMPGSSHNKMAKGEKFSYLVAQKRIRGDGDEATGNMVVNKKDSDGANDSDSFANDHLTKLLAQAYQAAANEDGAAAKQSFEQAQDLESRYSISSTIDDYDSDQDDADDSSSLSPQQNNNENDRDPLGLDLLRSDGKRQSMGRIVRAPIKKKGHIYIDYCAAPGRIIRTRVTKATSQNVAPGIYSAARKSRWGGFWPDLMDDGQVDKSDDKGK